MGLKKGNTVGICACRGEGLLVGEGGSDLAEAIKVVDITGKGRSGSRWNPRMRCAEPLRQPSLPLTIRNTIGVQAQHPSSQRMLAVVVEAVGVSECCFGGQIWQRDFLHSVKDQSGQRHVLARQAFDEVRRLAQRVTLGSGNHQESGVGRLQLRVRRLCPLTEPAE
jgi:hypothetical protein